MQPLKALLPDALRWARYFRRHGRAVACEDCGEEVRVHTDTGARLRSLACAACGGRLRTKAFLRRRVQR